MRRFTRILFSLPHNGGANSAPARERRGAKGPRERPSRGVGRSPTLVGVGRARLLFPRELQNKETGPDAVRGVSQAPVVDIHVIDLDRSRLALRQRVGVL